MKYFKPAWFFSLILLLLFFILIGTYKAQASYDKYSIKISRASYQEEITESDLLKVANGGCYSGLITILADVSVPEKNPWRLKWRVAPESKLPSGLKVHCRVAQGSTDAILVSKGKGDAQGIPIEIGWSVSDITPSGKYSIKLQLTVIGQQGHGKQVTAEFDLTINVHSFVKLWVVPEKVELSYAGFNSLSNKEDSVYIYIRSNTPWRLYYHMVEPVEGLPVEGKVVKVSNGINLSSPHWKMISTREQPLCYGGPTEKSWVLLRIRSSSSNSLRPQSYLFNLGFFIEANGI